MGDTTTRDLEDGGVALDKVEKVPFLDEANLLLEVAKEDRTILAGCYDGTKTKEEGGLLLEVNKLIKLRDTMVHLLLGSSASAKRGHREKLKADSWEEGFYDP